MHAYARQQTFSYHLSPISSIPWSNCFWPFSPSYSLFLYHRQLLFCYSDILESQYSSKTIVITACKNINRSSFFSRSCGSPYSMNIIIVVFRNIAIVNMRDIGNIKSPCRDISTDKNRDVLSMKLSLPISRR